jgi:hypothetical protein
MAVNKPNLRPESILVRSCMAGIVATRAALARGFSYLAISCKNKPGGLLSATSLHFIRLKDSLPMVCPPLSIAYRASIAPDKRA